MGKSLAVIWGGMGGEITWGMGFQQEAGAWKPTELIV